MGKDRVGHGILTWNGSERRTDRYGSFVLSQGDYNQTDRAAAHLDLKVLKPLVGKRVHVTCKVVKNRESGHIGDLFHGFRPSKPEIGEVVDLGVGTLQLEDAGFDGATAVVLEPDDGRDEFWIDPRKLYRLHDQTVDCFIEATKEPFTLAPKFEPKADAEETVDVGDGSFQAKSKNIKDGQPFRVEADIEKLGDGLFVLSPPTGREAGKRRKLVKS